MRIPLLLLFMIGIAFSQCPSLCNCTSRTLACELCLNTYFQQFDAITGLCQCYPNFRKYIGGGDYCCPVSCFKCVRLGCAQCYPHALAVWDNTIKVFKCVCDSSLNYYLSGTNCLCNSTLYPQQYYYKALEDKCMPCPPGCICNASGCVTCEPSTLRSVVQRDNGTSVCGCNPPYVNLNGTCACYIGCTCNNETVISCNQSSHRLNSYQLWECMFPYVEMQSVCQCVQPYTQMNVFGEIQCVCKSKIDFTMYYQVDLVCFRCGGGCVCDQRGCISCGTNLRIITSFQCLCAYNTTEANNVCTCVDPYYKGIAFGCSCLNILYPTLYYYDFKCRMCPDGCVCSLLGCIKCDNTTLRIVTQGQDVKGNNISSCYCIPNADDQNGVCSCGDQYQFDPASYSCVCNNVTSLVIVVDLSCKACPVNCKCDSNGCSFCYNSTGRVIVQLPNGDNTCPCMFNQVEINNMCICERNLVYNQKTRLCECEDPFETVLVEGVPTCLCKSESDSENYYFDNFTQECSTCPKDCFCGDNGCYDCSTTTMRFIATTYLKQVIINRCPCLQNAFLVNGSCTICEANAYYNGVGCITCRVCQTCDNKGCLSCYGNQTLVDRACVCDNLNLTNINGYCLCPKGLYLNIYNTNQTVSQCLVCPVFCALCSMVGRSIRCLSCNVNGTHRQLAPQNNCPCSKGYGEAQTPKYFCCDMYCQDCDINGCISCPLYTFRTLAANKCVCAAPYLDTGHIVCGCPTNSYYYNESCLLCPPSCLTCVANISTTSVATCIECAPNSNRDNSTNLCSCLQNFFETRPPSYFCLAQFCDKKEPNCTQCLNSMIVDENGLCVCPIGFHNTNMGCKACPMPGCLKCSSKNICHWCDQSNGFFLVTTVCLKVQPGGYLFFQSSSQGLVLQLKIQPDFPLNNTISSTIYNIQRPNSTDLLQYYPVDIGWVLLEKDVMIVKMDNPKVQLENVIISLLAAKQSGNVTSSIRTINIKASRLLSSTMLHDLDSLPSKWVWILVYAFIVMSTISTTMGYKHNQTIFYLQTLCFIGYFIEGDNYPTAQFLYNLRPIYFGFSNSPFRNFIPQFYVEDSPGNFRWLSIDGNLFRMANVAIFMSAILVGLYIVGKLVYCLIVNRFKINTNFIQYKKKVYRLFEFFFKTLMYPVLFFSLNTFASVHGIVLIDSNFKNWCIVASAILVFSYSLLVFTFYKLQNLSRLSRIQMVLELIFDLVAALAMPYSLNHKWIWVPVCAIILVSKDLSYYFLRNKIVRESNWVTNLQLVVIPIELSPLLPIYYGNRNWIVATLIFSGICQLVMQFSIIRNTNTLSHYDKLTTHVEQNYTSNSIIKGLD